MAFVISTGFLVGALAAGKSPATLYFDMEAEDEAFFWGVEFDDDEINEDTECTVCAWQEGMSKNCKVGMHNTEETHMNEGEENGDEIRIGGDVVQPDWNPNMDTFVEMPGNCHDGMWINSFRIRDWPSTDYYWGNPNNKDGYCMSKERSDWNGFKANVPAKACYYKFRLRPDGKVSGWIAPLPPIPGPAPLPVCELGCSKCGYNWYAKNYNNGLPTYWYWRHCGCCTGSPNQGYYSLPSQTQQKVCNKVCAEDVEYNYIVTPVKTWAEAEAYCRTKGGHLASIHSAEEDQIVAAFMRKYTTSKYPWLGGYSTSSNTVNTYKWSDGTAWDYMTTPWHRNDNHPNYLHYYRNKHWGTWCPSCKSEGICAIPKGASGSLGCVQTVMDNWCKTKTGNHRPYARWNNQNYGNHWRCCEKTGGRVGKCMDNNAELTDCPDPSIGTGDCTSIYGTNGDPRSGELGQLAMAHVEICSPGLGLERRRVEESDPHQLQAPSHSLRRLNDTYVLEEGEYLLYDGDLLEEGEYLLDAGDQEQDTP